MRLNKLRARAARKYKTTTHSAHTLPVAENLLKQDFSATKPNEKWVSDITYIWTEEGWLYLAVILDLFTRKVVGWHAAARMDVSLVLEALDMAIKIVAILMALFYIQIEGVNIVRGCTRKSYVAMVLFVA